ncbi:MAG: hypothetical protein MHPSP_003537, partial [Paramarteilia canceri]
DQDMLVKIRNAIIDRMAEQKVGFKDSQNKYHMLSSANIDDSLNTSIFAAYFLNNLDQKTSFVDNETGKKYTISSLTERTCTETGTDGTGSLDKFGKELVEKFRAYHSKYSTINGTGFVQSYPENSTYHIYFQSDMCSEVNLYSVNLNRHYKITKSMNGTKLSGDMKYNSHMFEQGNVTFQPEFNLDEINLPKDCSPDAIIEYIDKKEQDALISLEETLQTANEQVFKHLRMDATYEKQAINFEVELLKFKGQEK